MIRDASSFFSNIFSYIAPFIPYSPVYFPVQSIINLSNKPTFTFILHRNKINHIHKCSCLSFTTTTRKSICIGSSKGRHIRKTCKQRDKFEVAINLKPTRYTMESIKTAPKGYPLPQISTRGEEMNVLRYRDLLCTIISTAWSL